MNTKGYIQKLAMTGWLNQLKACETVKSLSTAFRIEGNSIYVDVLDGKLDEVSNAIIDLKQPVYVFQKGPNTLKVTYLLFMVGVTKEARKMFLSLAAHAEDLDIRAIYVHGGECSFEINREAFRNLWFQHTLSKMGWRPLFRFEAQYKDHSHVWVDRPLEECFTPLPVTAVDHTLSALIASKVLRELNIDCNQPSPTIWQNVCTKLSLNPLETP